MRKLDDCDGNSMADGGTFYPCPEKIVSATEEFLSISYMGFFKLYKLASPALFHDYR